MTTSFDWNTTGAATQLNGGNGNDYIDFAFGTRNLNNIAGSTTVTGGPGTDNIFVYDNNNPIATTYSVNDTRFDRPGWGGFFYAADVEGLTLTTGSAADTVNVPSTYPGQPVLINSSGGQDTVNLGNSGNGVQSIRAQVQIHNDPSFTTLNISDVGDTTARNVVIDQWAGNFGAMAGLAPGYITWDNSDIREIHITTGSGDDTVDVLRLSERLYLSSNGGHDQIAVGNDTDGLSQITGVMDVGPNPAFVFSDLTIKDTGGSIGPQRGLDPDENGFFVTGLPAGFRYENVLQLFVLGGNGADNYTVVAQTDNFINVDGGAGFNTMLVDDRTSPFAFLRSTFIPLASTARRVGFSRRACG